MKQAWQNGNKDVGDRRVRFTAPVRSLRMTFGAATCTQPVELGGCRMALSNELRNALMSKLVQVGWTSEQGFAYAPHRTMWLLEKEPWQGDLQDFHERMLGRLDRIERFSKHDPSYDSTRSKEDTWSLVKVLEELINQTM